MNMFERKGRGMDASDGPLDGGWHTSSFFPENHKAHLYHSISSTHMHVAARNTAPGHVQVLCNVLQNCII